MTLTSSKTRQKVLAKILVEHHEDQLEAILDNIDKEDGTLGTDAIYQYNIRGELFRVPSRELRTMIEEILASRTRVAKMVEKSKKEPDDA